jgi:hypothetical protein
MRRIKIVSSVSIIVSMVICSVFATEFPTDAENNGLGRISNNLIGAERNVYGIIRAVCITAAIGLFFASIMSYVKHRRNPFEVPLSSAVFNFIASLLVFALAFIPSEFLSSRSA